MAQDSNTYVVTGNELQDVDDLALHKAGAETVTGNKTLADAVDVPLGTVTGSKIGTAAAQKLAFHNATPVVQRASADQAAVPTDPATSTSPFGFSEAQANALVALVNELRAAAVEKGLIKGSA